MPIYLAQTILRTTDNNPENYATNTLYFETDNPTTSIPDIQVDIEAFYNSILGFYPSTISTTGHMTKWYLVGGPPPNYPIAELSWDFANPTSGNPLPSEVALCLSFQGERVAGEPQARKRGRIYIGPLDEQVLANDGRPGAAFTSALAGAGGILLVRSEEQTAWKWVVWSGTAQTATIIADGWVDNSFDTQRRRGVQWTQRELFPLPA